MIKLFFLCSFFFFYQGFGQVTKLKIEKQLAEIKQSERPFIVTIADTYSGSTSKQTLYQNNQFKISNNSINLSIISYEIMYKSKGKLCIYSIQQSDSAYKTMRYCLLAADKKTHFIFHDIKAVTKNNDTIFLNPISIRLLD